MGNELVGQKPGLPARAAVAVLTLQLRAALRAAEQAEADAALAEDAAARELRKRLDGLLEQRRLALQAELAQAQAEAERSIAAARRAASVMLTQTPASRNGSSHGLPTVGTMVVAEAGAGVGAVAATAATAAIGDDNIDAVDPPSGPVEEAADSFEETAQPERLGGSETVADLGAVVAVAQLTDSEQVPPADDLLIGRRAEPQLDEITTEVDQIATADESPLPELADLEARATVTKEKASAIDAPEAADARQPIAVVITPADTLLEPAEPNVWAPRPPATVTAPAAQTTGNVVLDAEAFATVFATVFGTMLDEKFDRLGSRLPALAPPAPSPPAPSPPAQSFWKHARHPDVILLGLIGLIVAVVLAAWLA
jgi:hypothetical protein